MNQKMNLWCVEWNYYGDRVRRLYAPSHIGAFSLCCYFAGSTGSVKFAGAFAQTNALRHLSDTASFIAGELDMYDPSGHTTQKVMEVSGLAFVKWGDN